MYSGNSFSPFRWSVIQRARELWALKPVFLDTETTGLKTNAEIIEISIVDSDGRSMFNSLVRPRKPIPLDVVRIHGITEEMVQTAPTWLRVWPFVEDALRGRVVGIYNAEFDLRLIQQTHQANGLPWRGPIFSPFDLMKMFSDFIGSVKWLTLEEAGRRAGISLANTHRALDDALLARALFMHMLGQEEA